MNVTIKLPASKATINALLEGLTALDFVLLSRGNLPPLYRSNVRYKREQPGREKWLTAEETFAAGAGDCEDLAAWRAAEYRLHGVPARAIVKRTGKRKFHAVVLLPGGVTEDPSRELGMVKGKRK